jgi:hypothetical protein
MHAKTVYHTSCSVSIFACEFSVAHTCKFYLLTIIIWIYFYICRDRHHSTQHCVSSLCFTLGEMQAAMQVAYLSCVTNVLLTNGGGQHIHSHESGSCLQTIFFVMLENFPLNITEIGHKSQLPSLYYPCQGTAGFAFCMRTISHLFKQSYMLTL